MDEHFRYEDLLGGLLLMIMIYLGVWMLYLVVPESWI